MQLSLASVVFFGHDTPRSPPYNLRTRIAGPLDIARGDGPTADGRWPRKNSASRRAARSVSTLFRPCARCRGRDRASNCGAIIGRVATGADRRSDVRRAKRIGRAIQAGPYAIAAANGAARRLAETACFSKAHERRSRPRGLYRALRAARDAELAVCFYSGLSKLRAVVYHNTAACTRGALTGLACVSRLAGRIATDSTD